jgi:Cu(I)/Ag(I) efflux system membrane protein CusA/SilA
LGGQKVTQTVEGRQRFPVRLRYAREYWQDADRIGDVLVTARTSPVELLKMESSSAVQSPPKQSEMNAKSQAGSGAMGKSEPSVGMPEQTTSVMQIPLRMVADIRVVEGPSMIKSENGRLRNYVTLNVRERDIVGFVDEARQAVKPIEATLAGTGMSVEWTGEFENQVRARQTMAVIFPMVVVLIMFLLYLTFRDILDMLLVSLAVVGALAGSVMFQAAFGFNFSVIVSIGYVAAFGMATQTGVIMLVYLREAIDRKGGLSAIKSLEELRELVIKGAVHRLRPKLLTEGVAIVGLVPMLWATGTGAEIMRPMAAPVLGGLLISDEVIDLMIPVLFYWIRRARWKKLHGEQPNDETRMTNETRSPNEEVVVPSVGLAQT